jgi:hypothetical protein
LGFNFNNAPPTLSGPGPSGTPQPAAPAPATANDVAAAPDSASPMSPGTAPATSDVPQSASLVRFRSCRWMQPAENGNTEFCTHREVKPYAGTAGFDADAWCPECVYYKLRRAPKKRNPDEYNY